MPLGADLADGGEPVRGGDLAVVPDEHRAIVVPPQNIVMAVAVEIADSRDVGAAGNDARRGDGMRGAAVSAPFLKEVGPGERYVVCVRFNARDTRGKYMGVKEAAAISTVFSLLATVTTFVRHYREYNWRLGFVFLVSMCVGVPATR